MKAEQGGEGALIRHIELPKGRGKVKGEREGVTAGPAGHAAGPGRREGARSS